MADDKEPALTSKEKKIEGPIKWLMVGTAILLDIFGWVMLFIPVLGELANVYMGVFGNLMFLLWFWVKGVSFKSAKRIFNYLGNFVGEEITLGFCPGFTIMVMATIAMQNSGNKSGV